MQEKEVNQSKKLAKKLAKLQKAKNELVELKSIMALEKDLNLENLQSAISTLKSESGVKNIRRLFFQMSLAFVSNQESGSDEDDLFDLLVLHEVINVI